MLKPMTSIPEGLPVIQHAPTIRYALDASADVIFEEWSGVVTKRDLEAHWMEYLKREDVMKCRRTVVDISRASIELRGYDLMDLIDTVVTPALQGRGWITAIVVHSDHQFGVGRQYGAFADLYSKDQVFRCLDEAVAWIRGKTHVTNMDGGKGR